jgi:hypothetical protein
MEGFFPQILNRKAPQKEKKAKIKENASSIIFLDIFSSSKNARGRIFFQKCLSKSIYP